MARMPERLSDAGQINLMYLQEFKRTSVVSESAMSVLPSIVVVNVTNVARRLQRRITAHNSGHNQTVTTVGTTRLLQPIPGCGCALLVTRTHDSPMANHSQTLPQKSDENVTVGFMEP
jgi:hypothetical protein